MVFGRLPVSAVVAYVAVVIVMFAGCGSTKQEGSGTESSSSQVAASVLDDSGKEHGNAHAEEMPELQPLALNAGEKLRVVATTGIMADVVGNVGGDAIDLVQLMPTGSDPHSFAIGPQDMRTLNDAHVVFMNGLGLEESLLPVLENLDWPVPLVSVNAGVETLQLGSGHEADDGDQHSGADPHTWFSVPNVMSWTDNIATALGTLDPAHTDIYQTAAANYSEQLDELDRDLRAQIGTVPEENRKLVTDHVALAYLADEYGLRSVGSVVPSLSTLAAASAQELAALQEAMRKEGVKAIFVSTTVNPQTVEQVAGDLGIPVVKLYVGSLSNAGGPASTYVELMRYDVAQIVDALR